MIINLILCEPEIVTLAETVKINLYPESMLTTFLHAVSEIRKKMRIMS